MADEKVDVSKQTTVKETSVDSKPATQVGPTSESHDHADGTTPKRGAILKKMVPMLVLLLAGGILFGITGGWTRFVGSGGKQRTDDAYLRSDITPLSTRVSGTVAQVAVSDYQRVKSGDLLVHLKDDD